MVFQLTYELKTLDRDYTPFYNFLEKDAGDSAIHVLRDSWWIHSSGSVTIADMCEKIREHLGDTDIFYLSELQQGSINGWMPSSHWKWYNDHMK